MRVKTIKLDSFAYRAALLAPALLLVSLAFFTVKWALANTASSRAEFKEVADLTVSMAPDDPQTHYSSAVLHERTFLPEDLVISLSEFEKAAALAPHNYLLWLQLGRSRERSGDSAGSERALRRALELAPNYSEVQWALGNNLLRQGRPDDGFVLIQKAATSDERFTNTAAATAWEFFEGDLARVKKAIGDSPRISAALAGYLARQKKFDEAFTVWDSLPADEKRTSYRASAETFYGQLIEAKKYRDAARIYSEVLAGEGVVPVAEQVTNGGFESALRPGGAPVFDWQVADSLQPQVGQDTGQKHSGERSLVMIINSADGKDFRSVNQTIVSAPGKAYRLSLFYRSELTTGATYFWEIADAADGKPIASTDAAAASTDWTEQQVKFTVPANTEAVVVRLARAHCGTGICPISGRIWFDDFSLSAE
jgi:tetratricopeptide (TPR) repeat protein